MGKNKYGNVEKDDIETIINNNYSDKNMKVYKDGKNVVVEFVDTNRYYKIDDGGNVSEFEVIHDTNPGDITVGKDGETLDGSEEHPY